MINIPYSDLVKMGVFMQLNYMILWPHKISFSTSPALDFPPRIQYVQNGCGYGHVLVAVAKRGSSS